MIKRRVDRRPCVVHAEIYLSQRSITGLCVYFNLLSETKEFVSELFNTLKTKTYLPNPPPQPTTPTQSTSQNASVPQASNEAIVNSVNSNSAVPGCSENKQEAKGPPPRKPSSEKVF